MVGYELVGLTDALRAAPAAQRGVIELHVGGCDEGDVHEAALLAHAAEEAGAAGGCLSCTLEVHEGRDHNLVVEMRDSGELHDLLVRLVAADPARGGATESLPSQFVGFHDCPDF